ncbi:hypothetical protein NOG11_07155 [Parvularcula sp. BGMRC 0090]|uniref:Uncharacterized protein n=1 Tax=Parvularcula maris TaxID=2965077 RepID=A0A9X2L8R9_9PROT|nr:hypothetical protein [Parvularcula maris]
MAVLCAVFSGYYYTEQRGRQANRPDEAANPSYEEVIATCEDDPAGLSVECLREAQDAYREEYRAYADLQAQQDVALWAFVAVCFGGVGLALTGVGVWFIRDTLVATRETLSQARNTNEAAWNAVDATKDVGQKQIAIALRTAEDQRKTAEISQAAIVIPVELRTYRPRDGLFLYDQFKLRYENIGPTAALNVRVCITAFPFGEKVPYRFNIPDPPKLGQRCSTVLPTGRSHVFATNEFDSARSTWDQIAYARGFRGLIIWDDIFSNTRGYEFVFAQKSEPFGPQTPPFILARGSGLIDDRRVAEYCSEEYKPQRPHTQNHLLTDTP